MSLRSTPKKIALAIRLVRRPVIELEGKSYQMRGYVLNPLWLDQRRGVHEPWLDEVFRAAFRCRDGAFIDVGANIGRTLLKVLALDDTRQYVGFEPQPSCSAIIHEFIRVNRLSRHTILPIGLGSENKTVKLLIGDTDFDPTASIVQSFRPDSFYTRHHYVCLRNGDEVLAELELRAIAVIKIDVEGAELEVIEGLSRTIRERQPFIVFEVLNFYLIATNQPLAEQTIKFRQQRIERLEQLLRGFGHHIYRIVPEGLEPVARIQPESTQDLTRANYVAVPRDVHERFLHHLRTTAHTH
jgi:FkbM family methyltransferase